MYLVLISLTEAIVLFSTLQYKILPISEYWNVISVRLEGEHHL